MRSAVLFGVLALAGGCGGRPAAAVVEAAPAPSTPTPAVDTPSNRYPAPFTTEPAAVTGRVTWVADGDTLDVTLPSGRVRIRLLGVDTPEKQSKYTSAEPWGREVSEIVRKRLAGATVGVIAKLSGRDAYGRVLGYVQHDGIDLGAWLLEHGHARLFRAAQHPRRERYERLEAAARAAARGIWGGPPGHAGGLIGNRRSKLLHAPHCRSMPAERNRVPFTSRAEAERAGYRPHRACLGDG